jgi:hypothetical protein
LLRASTFAGGDVSSGGAERSVVVAASTAAPPSGPAGVMSSRMLLALHAETKTKIPTLDEIQPPVEPARGLSTV